MAKHIHKRQTNLLSGKVLHKDYGRKVHLKGKKSPVVSLKELGAKAN
jgi:hypothetical protein